MSSEVRRVFQRKDHLPSFQNHQHFPSVAEKSICSFLLSPLVSRKRVSHCESHWNVSRCRGWLEGTAKWEERLSHECVSCKCKIKKRTAISTSRPVRDLIRQLPLRTRCLIMMQLLFAFFGLMILTWATFWNIFNALLRSSSFLCKCFCLNLLRLGWCSWFTYVLVSSPWDMFCGRGGGSNKDGISLQSSQERITSLSHKSLVIISVIHSPKRDALFSFPVLPLEK